MITVLDSGVDAAHPDVAAKMVAGYSFYDNNTNTSDVYGHGTNVAGSATDDRTVSRVELLRDGTLVGTDTTAPTVSINQTSRNRDKLSVSVVASDNVAVTKVELYVDGVLKRRAPT